jgi:hypothetical protein
LWHLIASLLREACVNGHVQLLQIPRARAESPKENSPGQSESASDALGQRPIIPKPRKGGTGIQPRKLDAAFSSFSMAISTARSSSSRSRPFVEFVKQKAGEEQQMNAPIPRDAQIRVRLRISDSNHRPGEDLHVT